MENKPYRLGITVGRFQTFHNGHKFMIDKAVALCDSVGVFIGSSQESGTAKNPFDYETRRRLLKKIYGDTVRVFPLPDIGVGNNARWGDYVIGNVEECFGELPDLLVSGKEERRIDWFDSIRALSIAELYVPKIIDISASQMREYFLSGNVEAWKRFSDPALWDEFDTLKRIVEAAQGNTETASI